MKYLACEIQEEKRVAATAENDEEADASAISCILHLNADTLSNEFEKVAMSGDRNGQEGARSRVKFETFHAADLEKARRS